MYIKDEHCDGSFFYDSHNEHVILLYDNNTASRMFMVDCAAISIVCNISL